MKTTFRIFILLCFLIYSERAFSQSSKVQQLEQEIANSAGVEKIEKTIALVDVLLANSDFVRAEELASNAEDAARKLQAKEWIAISLNREGKALMSIGKKGFLGREKSAPKFLKSLDLLRSAGSNNKPLQLDNLQNLRLIADRRGRTEEVAQIDEQIVKIQTGGSNITSLPSNHATQVTPTPNGAPTTVIMNTITSNRAEEERLLKESQVLQSLLAQKEADISAMTAEQMKTELLLLQKNQVLDSMTYRSRLDSLEVSNWNLALREAESNRKGGVHYKPVSRVAK